MRMKRASLIIVMIVFAFAKAYSQSTITSTQTSSKKIGLVLSGGGAKGFAHIGALKVIDSLGIKIDYIAGTSMGAVIGSLYASGYTGKQLDSIFQTINFDNIISDDIPRKAKTFYERKENEKYAVTLPFRDFKIDVPTSLSKGQNVYNLLSRLLSHVKDVQDFSTLKTPFMCVATDVVTGKEVILENGYLPKAVNASAALPSIFAPVEVQEQLLIDGGVSDNYPIDKLLDKGMDIIIGVDVQDGLRDREELVGAFDLLNQINNFSTISEMVVKKPKTDIYIAPDVMEFTVISFGEGDEIIKRGERAAKREIAKLKKVGTKDYSRPELNKVASDSIYISKTIINGNKNYTRSYINGRFKIKVPGKVAYKDLRNGINNLQATNNFSKINYEITPSPDGDVLEIDVIESNVRNYLRLGIHFDELLRSSALVNLSRKRLLFNNDIASFDLILGDNTRYNLDYYIDKGRYWSIGIHSEFVQFDKNISARFVNEVNGETNLNVNRIDTEYNDWTQQLYFQTRLQNDFYVRIGAEHKQLNIFTETVINNAQDDDRTTFENSDYGSLYGSIIYDSYDNAFFPKEGWQIHGDFHLYLYNNNEVTGFNEFSIAQLSIGKAHSLGKVSLRGTALAGLPIGYPANSSLDFFLGGYGARRINNILPFYGYDFISLSGNSVLKALFEVDYELFPKNHLIASANFANIEDYLFRQSDWYHKARYTGYAIGYGLETFLGPIELKYSFSPQQEMGEFYVNLGFSF